MKKFLLTMLVVIPLNLFGFNDLDKTLNNYYTKNNIKVEQVKVDDYTFARRVYIDFAGRIPTLDEIKAYVTSQNPNKKELLLDKIFYSEDYVNNLYNFWADMLRIRPERLGDTIQMKAYPYMEYVRDFIRGDKPYDSFVSELLTATGRVTDNPATSYLIRDDGMALDNLATSTQIFVGKDISCAQCHDDPFQDYTQHQFYEFAAFFNNTNRENRKTYRDELKKVDEDIKEIKKTDRIDNNVRQIMSANLFNVQDDINKQTRLPHDYKYSDGKPNDIVMPVSLDGKMKDIKDNKRQNFAKWITSQPDFSYCISNRLWEEIVGNNLVYPENKTNFYLTNKSPNYSIVSFLGEYLKQNNYSIKSLLRMIAMSDFYSRPAYSGNKDDYKNQSPMIVRMNSYKVWDSMITLILPDSNYSRISFDDYAKIFRIDWEKINGEYMLKKADDIREYDKQLSKSFLNYKGIDLVRSCFLLNRNNGFAGLFLKEF